MNWSLGDTIPIVVVWAIPLPGNWWNLSQFAAISIASLGVRATTDSSVKASADRYSTNSNTNVCCSSDPIYTDPIYI